MWQTEVRAVTSQHNGFFFCLFVLCDKVVFHAKLPEASKVTALFFSSNAT